MMGTQLFARLRQMRDEGGAFLYQRIKLADELLGNRDWVEAPEGGGGDEGLALDRLQEECFGDICGLTSLPELLEVYRKWPDEKVWKEHKYNVRRLVEVLRPKREVVNTPQMKNNVAPVLTAPATPATVEQVVLKKDLRIQELVNELTRAHERIRELEKEVRLLKKRLEKVHRTSLLAV